MRRLVSTLATLALICIGAMAHAQTTVTVGWIGPQTPAAGAQYNYSLNYTVSGGGADNVSFTVTLPGNVAVLGVSLPQDNGVPTFGPGSGCTKTSAGSGWPAFDPWEFECEFTASSLTPSAGSISGTITLALLYRSYGFNDGQDEVIAATFSSDQATVTATHDIEVQANAAMGLDTTDTFNNFTPTSASWDPDGLGPLPAMAGMMYRIPSRVYNAGNAPLQPGIMTELPLGPNTYLVSYDLGGWTVDASSTATPGSAGNTLVLSYGAAVGTSGALNGVNAYSLSQFSPRFWVTVFIPCTKLGANLNSGATPDVPFTLWAEATEDKVPLGGGFGSEDAFFQDDTPVPTSGSTAGYFFEECGTPGTMAKWSSPEWDAPVGELVTWYLSTNPPTGDAPWDEALIVDPLPPEVEFANAVMLLAGTGTTSLSFEIYLCRLPPAMRGVSFNLNAFSGHVTATVCRPRTDFFSGNTVLASLPWPIVETTHVAAYADPWADVVSGTDPSLTMYRAEVNITTRVKVTTPDDTLITNRFYLYGVVGAETREFGPMVDTVTAQGEANPVVRVFALNPLTNLYSNVFAPGDGIDFGISFGRGTGIVLFRPIVRVDFPVGIQINSISFNDINDTCPDLPGANGAPGISGPTLDDGGTPGNVFDDHYFVEIDALLGAPAADLYTSGCSYPIYWDWTRNAFRASGTVIANYPHVTSNTLIAISHLTVSNVSNVDADDGLPANERAFGYPFNVITSSEMRVRVEAGCSPDLGPAFVTYDYIMENTAGTHLSAMELVMTVPKVGVPAGNTTNANFVSVTAPLAGETVQYSTDSGASFSPTVPANLTTITHVKFLRDALLAYDTRTVTLVTSHATNVPLGTDFLTAAVLDSAELSPVPNSDYDAWETGDCPAKLVVFKYFDSQAPAGTYNAPNDQPLSGWEFSTAGPTVDSGTTGLDGEVTFLVLPGSYAVTETLPTGGAITWTPTSAGGVTQNVAIGLSPTYRLEFGNVCACDDDNSCTADSCVFPGTCSSTPTPGALCDPQNLCGECDSQGDCVDRVLDCGDSGTCEGAGQCDPATGGCVFGPMVCEPLPVYVIVNGPDGQPAGTVKCTVLADKTVSCVMDAGGVYVAIDPTLWCPGE